MGILKTLKKILKLEKKLVQVPLDPETIKNNTTIKALAYENSELKGEVARLKDFLYEIKEREENKNEEEYIKANLSEEKDEINSKYQKKVFSLRSFFAKYFKEAKFREGLGFYSFDRMTRISNFGDIGIAEDGDFVLFDDKNEIIMKSSSLKDIFQSVGALGNDITRGVIPVNLDKDGGFVENIMVYEAPELIPDGEGNLKYTKARKKPVFELIQGYLNQVGEARLDLAEAEATIKELQDTIDRLKLDNNLLEETSETSRAELSATKQKVIGIDKTMGDLQRNLINFQNLSSINQDRINMTDKQLEEMREKAERKGTKLSDEKALETILDIRSTISNEMPDIQQQGGQTQGNVTTPSK